MRDSQDKLLSKVRSAILIYSGSVAAGVLAALALWTIYFLFEKPTLKPRFHDLPAVAAAYLLLCALVPLLIGVPCALLKQTRGFLRAGFLSAGLFGMFVYSGLAAIILIVVLVLMGSFSVAFLSHPQFMILFYFALSLPGFAQGATAGWIVRRYCRT